MSKHLRGSRHLGSIAKEADKTSETKITQLREENKRLREIIIREVDDGRAEVDDIGIEAWLERALLEKAGGE